MPDKVASGKMKAITKTKATKATVLVGLGIFLLLTALGVAWAFAEIVSGW